MRITLGDAGMSPAHQDISSLATCELFSGKAGGVAETTLSTMTISVLDSVESDRTVQFVASPPKPIQGDGKDSNQTCYVPSDAESSQVDSSDLSASFSLRDSREESATGLGTMENITVPGYDILEELGRGGMGVVYKARHRRLKRLVALKMVLAGAHVGAVGLARFRAEAEAVAKLPHANIVQLYESGEHEGRPFFSLEYVDGGSLDQRINESSTSPRVAAQLIETLARTIQVAHQAGIVHRDLKPANILLAKVGSQSSIVRSRDSDSNLLPADHWSRNTVPKIADFGLAKKVNDDSSQTRSGTILGTPSYMAPEQAGGKNREVGPAADIYSLGAIFYELLVGRPPFRAGNPMDTIRQVLEQEPIPPRQLEPRVPPDLETICLKCLEKDAARRFSSALDLAEDLRRFAEGDPILARPTPAWERAWKWGKRRPAIVALLGVSMLAVFSIALFIVWHNVSLQRKLDLALSEERLARSREQETLMEHHRTLVEQEARRLFDSARVAVAASDWSTARIDLEKSLTTMGGRGTPRHLEGVRSNAARPCGAGAAHRDRSPRISGPLPGFRQAPGRGPVPRHPLYGDGSGRQPGGCARRCPRCIGGLSRPRGFGRPAAIRCLSRRCSKSRRHCGLLSTPVDPRRDRSPVLNQPAAGRERPIPAPGPRPPTPGSAARCPVPGVPPASGGAT